MGPPTPLGFPDVPKNAALLTGVCAVMPKKSSPSGRCRVHLGRRPPSPRLYIELHKFIMGAQSSIWYK